MAYNARPPHPATLVAGSVAQPSGISGGKGGLTYGDALNDRSSAVVEQAMSNLNMTGVKGHGLGGGGSHESSQTVNDRKKLVAEVKKLEAKAYKASRPKATIRQDAPQSPYEKAKLKAAELKLSVKDTGDRQEQFDEYIAQRSKATKWEPTSTEWDALYAILDVLG